ncbi:extensin [Bradyrhizobium guangdongense]|uniref:extensin family protein n=1 Tax=Bradyrhizobium guangdongense TaxID=1325090 RepID=UPI0011280E8A|nr:extensin family protein [Bradyrhizobium guangdongense]TPQ33334.1 extensin [Bradyrhizobium guangdongense]
MNFSLRNHRRKWSCRGFMSAGAAMVTVALGAALLPSEPAQARRYPPPLDLFGLGTPKPTSKSASKPRATVHAAKIPLPRPRPAEAPKAVQEAPAAVEKPAAEKSAEPAAPPERQLSACRQALTEEIAIAPSIPDIKGPGGCGGEDLVRLEAIVLPDKRKVSVKPAAILRCAMASAIADWVRSDVAPLAASQGSTVSELDNFDSFECRGRNRVAGAMLSEHGRANALDVRAFKLANGQSINLTDRTVARDVRERVLHSVCSRFTTVLGPGSDWYHEDHIHLDIMQRRNDYRICQWNVWDPLPRIAPLLPAERPEEAPPREVAAKTDGTKADRTKTDGAKNGTGAAATKPDAEPEEAPAAEPEPPRRPATKKRR